MEDYLKMDRGLIGPQGCRAYLLLLHHYAHADRLLAHLSRPQSPWDYRGRYVVVGLTARQMQALTETLVGKKTENLMGLVQVRRERKRERITSYTHSHISYSYVYVYKKDITLSIHKD